MKCAPPCQRREHAFGAGIVEGDVQLAVGVHGKLDHGNDVGFAGHVDHDGGSDTALGGDLGYHLVQLTLAAGSGTDLCSSLSQDNGSRTADARAGAGDQRDFALELAGSG